MDEELVDLIETIAILASSGVVVWMIVRACAISRLSYSTEIQGYSTFLKVSLVFSLLIPVAQLGIGILAIFDETPTNSSKGIPSILLWDYILLVEYVTILLSGWLTSCFIMVLQYRTLHESREWCLIIFWGYYCLLHFFCGILRIIVISGDETELKIVGIALHFFAGFACAMLEVSFACTKDDVTRNAVVAENIVTSFTDSLLEPAEGSSSIKAYTKKCKVTDEDIVCTIVSVVEGSRYKVKRRYKDFATLDFKLATRYTDEIKSGKFIKPLLPRGTNARTIKGMENFQREMNEYLTLLCKSPKREFTNFLTEKNYEPTPGVRDSLFSMYTQGGSKYKDDDFVLDPVKSLHTAELLKSLWRTETLVDVRIKLNYASFAEEILYTIGVTYKGSKYQVEKTLFDICTFYDSMRNRFKEFPFIRLNLNNENTTVLDKAKLGKLEEFFLEVFNDTDLFCTEACNFFDLEVIKEFRYIPLLLRAENPLLKGFKVEGVAEKCSFEVDYQKNIRVAFVLDLRMEEDNVTPTRTWSVTKTAQQFLDLHSYLKKRVHKTKLPELPFDNRLAELRRISSGYFTEENCKELCKKLDNYLNILLCLNHILGIHKLRQFFEFRRSDPNFSKDSENLEGPLSNRSSMVNPNEYSNDLILDRGNRISMLSDYFQYE